MATGCTKDYDINPGQSKTPYVIDGRISNLLGPYYIRITKATNSFGKGTSGLFGWDNAEPVTGAVVIIADDMGLTDTLRPADPNEPRYDSAFSADRGYYETTKVTGQPGRTYQLRVRIGTEEFQASAYMPSTVPDIDSALLKKDLVADPSGLIGNAAFAYFKEPRDETNYYMLQQVYAFYTGYDRAFGTSFGGTTVFPYYVFDDKTLPAYVVGMEVMAFTANNFAGKRFGPHWIFSSDSAQVRLSALTRETYEYFNALGRQFLNDGNVYKPAPASAAGNISGGALGLFWAANISMKAARR